MEVECAVGADVTEGHPRHGASAKNDELIHHPKAFGLIMADNVIPFPGSYTPEEPLEDVTVFQCPEEGCDGTKFFLEVKDTQRVICATCFVISNHLLSAHKWQE